jgi:hypothetical protein
LKDRLILMTVIGHTYLSFRTGREDAQGFAERRMAQGLRRDGQPLRSQALDSGTWSASALVRRLIVKSLSGCVSFYRCSTPQGEVRGSVRRRRAWIQPGEQFARFPARLATPDAPR